MIVLEFKLERNIFIIFNVYTAFCDGVGWYQFFDVVDKFFLLDIWVLVVKLSIFEDMLVGIFFYDIYVNEVKVFLLFLFQY